MDDQKSGVPNVGDDQNQNQAQQPQPTPVSPKQKEQGPGQSMDQKVAEVAKLMQMSESDKVAKEEGDEYWENYAREIELEKEVLEMGGVEKIDQGEVQVPDKIAKEMGIQNVPGAHSPMSQTTGFSVSGVTLDDNQLTTGIQKPTSSGFKWLAEWFIYQLLKAHYHITRVKDKVIRSKA